MGDKLPVVAMGAGAPPQLVVSGDRHVCALLVGGAAKCWGEGFDGQLGHGSRTSLYENLPVVSLGAGRTVTALSAASRGRHSCAVLDDRHIKCWGWNEVWQLGLGDTRTRGDDPGEMGDALGTVPLW